ncbi:MAG TPA: hypothetical protein VK448_08195 [Dissulfurispiraceae bacterium]|nr:hypothetical protein [Dissulfurispiraceae bacterium]
MPGLLNLFRDFALKHNFADEAFIVGGTVRDLLLGRQINDADITVRRDAIDTGRSFADAAGGSFVLLDKDYGVTRVVKGSEHLDICAMRGNSISDDLAGRDLSINAMAVPLSSFANQKSMVGSEDLRQIVIDPYNGLQDLKYRIVRMVSEENLVKDPLRLLRVYRFAAELNFTIEVHTSSAVRANATLISQPAVERIADELRHIFQSAASYQTITEMEKSGLLFHLFPELPEYPGEVWQQIRYSYGYAEHILHNLNLYFPGRSASIQSYIDAGTRTFCLKLAALFQDGKTVEKIADRLKLSRREAEFIAMLTVDEDFPTLVDERSKPLIIRRMKTHGDDIYALLIFSLATRRVCQLSGNPLISSARDIVALYEDEFIPRRSRLPLINGNDLTDKFSLSPSPLFREILSAIDLLALEGRINTRAEALEEAGRMIRIKGANL